MHTIDNIYSKSLASKVKIKPYKFKRLSHNTDFWTAWKTGRLEGKSQTRVLYKLSSAMQWARFTKEEVLHMLRSWHRIHGLRSKPLQLELIYSAVEEWIKPKIRERKRLEMRRYRERKRQQKALEEFKVQVAGGSHE